MKNNNDRSWVEINLDNFEYNVKNLKKFFEDKKYLQIVKADAYGHGDYQIATKAIELGADFLGVANYQEALLLRFQKIDIPILILSPSLDNEIIPIVNYDLIPSVQSYDFAKKLNEYAKIQKKVPKIHINVDTGMGRSGFYYNDALNEIEKIKKLKNIEIEGIFSHFAASENDTDYTNFQYKRYIDLLKNLSFKPKFTHILNSSGVVNFKENLTNLVRLGLLSYGVYTDKIIQEKIRLKTVMSFFTKISHIKTAYKGESIGYNRTFIADKKIKYAILPVGYADGYDFLLSSKGKVFYKDTLCPVLGKVSMDMIAIDISAVENAKVGDTVQLLGDKDYRITPESLASYYNGSAYELLCQIGRRAKRYYIDDKSIIDSSPLSRRSFVPSDYSPQKLSDIIETAISHRIKSKEISTIIYKDFLERFFKEKDKNIHYRENFVHKIEFVKEENGFYKVDTTLEYDKILTNDYFYVNCAKNEKILETFFDNPKVEYRWLLDSKIEISKNKFTVTSVKINDINLNLSTKEKKEYITIKCYHPNLKDLLGKKVKFSISTQTFYPVSSHQLSVYINELTKNIKIIFLHNGYLKKVETVPFFTGNSNFPTVKYIPSGVEIYTKSSDWVFPKSGVVFAY